MNHERIPSFGGDVKPSVLCTEEPYLYMLLAVSFEKSRVLTPGCPNPSRCCLDIHNLSTDMTCVKAALMEEVI